MHPNDAHLIRELESDSDEAVNALREWVRKAQNPFRFQLGDDYDDVAQDALEVLSRTLRSGTFKGESRLRTYVTSVARNMCVDRLRHKTRRTWVRLEDLELTSNAASPLERITRKERTELAQRLIAEMPAQCQTLWSMLQDGLSYRQMAEQTGVSENTLRSRMHRCRLQAMDSFKKSQEISQRISRSDD